MKNKIVFCLLFLALQPNLFGQIDTLNTIAWSEEKLTWEDYKAEPNPDESIHAASTTSGISYSWSYIASMDEFALDFVVKTLFYPKRSWVKPDKKLPELLAHEQLHFDISELFARKLLTALNAYVPKRNIRSDLRRIYSKIESERNKMQMRYDKETKHGLDKKAQEKWNQKIAEALLEVE